MAEVTAGLVKTLRDKTNAGMMDCKKALIETGGDLEAAVDWLRKKGLAAAAKRSGRVASEGLIGVAMGERSGAVVEVNTETDFVARNSVFQEFVGKVARIALDARGDVATILATPVPDSGRTVADEVTHLAATIGENITFRRADFVSVERGLVASYIHSSYAPGLGRIGVLVAVESDHVDATTQDVGRKLAMHVAAANPMSVGREGVAAEALDRERNVLIEQARASGKPDAVVQKMVEGRLNKFYEEVCLVEQPFVMDPQTKVGALLQSLGGEARIERFVRFALGEGIEKSQEDAPAAA